MKYQSDLSLPDIGQCNEYDHWSSGVFPGHTLNLGEMKRRAGSYNGVEGYRLPQKFKYNSMPHRILLGQRNSK